MALFRKDEPLTAATVRSFDRIPDRPTYQFKDGELWQIYRCVPEIHYAVNQQARLVGRLDWRIRIDGEDIEESDDIIRRAFGADLRGITVMATIHLQVAGQFYLARIDGAWTVLNSDLVGEQKRQAERADILVHVIIEDPAIPTQADSPVMAVRDLAAELILTRAQARATARSRTAQTMTVLYPKEGAGGNPGKFERDLASAITEPLADEKSSAVAVPNFIAWPAQYIDGWKPLDLTGPVEENLHERVDRLIRQIAIGLDITPTLLLGMEDSNHWTAWATLEDNWLGHVEPLAAPVGQAIAEALRIATDFDADRIEVVPDPTPLLKRRPAISDVLQAARDRIVTVEWAAEQLGAPPEAYGSGIPEPSETIEVEQGDGEPSVEESERRQLESTQDPPSTAAPEPTIDGARLADIDDQAYTSLQDLIFDIAERALEKLGARIRSMAQGRNVDLPRDASNLEIARLFTGEIPNAAATITQVAEQAAAKVWRVIERAQGRLRAMGIDVQSDPEDPRVTAAQAAFVTAVAGAVVAMRGGRPGVAEAWEAARQVVTIAGGGNARDFTQAASGIALAASTMRIIRRDHGLAPPTGPEAYRWLHLYEGPQPHPVHDSLNDALFNGESVFAGGFEAFPGDHAGCQCIAVPADMINVRTGWRGNQP